MSALTLVVVSAKYKRLLGDPPLHHLTSPLVLQLMYNEIVVCVGHPLKLPEEPAPEQLPRWLRLLHLQGLLHSLLGRFQELVRCQFRGEVTQRGVVAYTETSHYHVVLLVREVVEYYNR